MIQRVLGIDPGLDGGIAIYTFGSPNDPDRIECFPMPVMATSDSKREIDVAELKSLLMQKIPGVDPFKNITLAVIEKVGAMPKQGVTSTFTFGVGYGDILGSLKWQGIPFMKVTPQRWKGTVLTGTAKDKGAAINFVLNMFPGVNLKKSDRAKVHHDGMADAVCIAFYGRQILRGNLNVHQ